MAEKADVTPALNKPNREKTKPLAERPHAMRAEDVHDMYFYGTPFHHEHPVRK